MGRHWRFLRQGMPWSYLCSLEQSSWLQGECIGERKSKDATALVQARSNEGLCQGRNSRNAGGEIYSKYFNTEKR